MDGDYTGAEHTYMVETLDNIKTPIISENYNLSEKFKSELLSLPTPFSSAYAESIFFRTYSRKKSDGTKESWGETVIRVVEGTIGAYLTHYKRNGLTINYKWLDEFTEKMAKSFFYRRWSPPGRGLYAMGTNHTRNNGNAALNNCYACETKNLVLAASWAMDQLMCGGGVGFDCSWDGLYQIPNKEDYFIFVIPDTRQGWVAALELLLRSYLPVDGKITNKFPKFDYSKIRKFGAAIRGFGGTASGPEPLRILLQRVEIFMDTYINYNESMKIMDCGNLSPEESAKIIYWRSLMKTTDKIRGKIILDSYIGCPESIKSIYNNNLEESAQAMMKIINHNDKKDNIDSISSEEINMCNYYIETIKTLNCGDLSFEEKAKILRSRIFMKLANSLHEIGAYTFGNFTRKIIKLERALENYDKVYDKTRLVVDILNAIGACVVAGNVRRSAEIAIGDAGDKTFLDLKNKTVNPERQSISWMSNNTVRFSKHEDFEQYIPEIASRIQKNGEPGFYNLINAQKYGRYSNTDYGPDKGTLLNPCGEIILESFEPCTLATVCPSNCIDDNGNINMVLVTEAAQFATFYATVVTTVKHHWGVSNAVIAHNRRIGVSLTGIANIYEVYGFTYLTTLCRSLYKEIREYNEQLARKAGIPRAIRVTTVKPEGTLSIIMEVNAGVHFPICRYAKRRIGYAKNDELLEALKEAGYPFEQSTYSESMVYVIYPIENGKCRPEREVSIYEQFGLSSALQRSFSDNSVSFTGHFSIERESEDVERVIAMFAPQIKSCSLLPYSDDISKPTQYKHMPFEEISETQFLQLKSSIKPVVWKHNGDDAVQPQGCTNDTCYLPNNNTET